MLLPTPVRLLLLKAQCVSTEGRVLLEAMLASPYRKDAGVN